jgi:hypothetical protein
MAAAMLTTAQDLSEGCISTYEVQDGSNPVSRWMIASPYLQPSHLLDLTTLDNQSRLLALALRDLTTATEDYAVAAYEKAIDLEGLISSLKSLLAAQGLKWAEQSFYVVDFRSTLKSDIDRGLLFMLDKKSHEEATQSGGLLKYWYGEPDAERRNLATCEYGQSCFQHNTKLSRLLEEQRRRYQGRIGTLAQEGSSNRTTDVPKY